MPLALSPQTCGPVPAALPAAAAAATAPLVEGGDDVLTAAAIIAALASAAGDPDGRDGGPLPPRGLVRGVDAASAAGFVAGLVQAAFDLHPDFDHAAAVADSEGGGFDGGGGGAGS